jgi:hypothetical protein
MPKQPVSEEVARIYLRDVEPMWRAFWFHMHSVARNLEEFTAEVGEISDEVFAYHVSGQKNDLAGWVQEVIGDSVLARELAGVKDQHEAHRACTARVAELKRALTGK